MKQNLKHRTIETFHFGAALNVVMILLIFVMIILAANVKYGIKIKIGSLNEIDSKGRTVKVISINDDGNIYFVKEKISFDDLHEKLMNMKNNKEDSFVIFPAPGTKINTVGKIIRAVKDAGIKNITIQTNPSLL